MSERTLDGLAAARARGRTGGQKPKLTTRQAKIAQEMYEETGPDAPNLLPIWPYATVARLENEGEVDGEHAIEISADVFLKDWLPQLREDDADIAVFPVEERNAAILTLAEFRSRMTVALRMN